MMFVLCVVWGLLGCQRSGSLHVSPTMLRADACASQNLVLTGPPVARLLELTGRRIGLRLDAEIRFNAFAGEFRVVRGNTVEVGFAGQPPPGSYRVVLRAAGGSFAAVERVEVVGIEPAGDGSLPAAADSAMPGLDASSVPDAASDPDASSSDAGIADPDASSSDAGVDADADSGGGLASSLVFPPAPILGASVPAQTPQVFAEPDAVGAGPCLLAPEVHGPGAMLPSNWLPPRFDFVLPSGHDVAELRLRSPTQQHDLVVYTSATRWTMPAEMWAKLVVVATGQPIEVRVRSAQVSGAAPSAPQLGSTGMFRIAPVPAAGSIVYSDKDDTTGESLLRGFRAGSEPVQTVVRASQVSPSTRCIGCHASTPDGQYIAFSESTSPTLGNPATIVFSTPGGQVEVPPFMSAAGKRMTARRQQHVPSFSRAHWTPGDRIMLSMLKSGETHTRIIWTDLEAASDRQGQGWDVIERMGDSGEPSGVDFSPDGTKIVYASGPADVGTIVDRRGDLYVVPYNQKQGGAATRLEGGSTPDFSEFVPSFSPNSRLVVFGRVPNNEKSANNPNAEILVVPADGGAANRLAANDPPECTGRQSPGIANAWPRWAPEASEVGTRTYYWLLFSSRRLGANRQLFIAGLMEEAGMLTSYNAVHLWNQPQARNILTPTWQNVVLPPP